MSDVFCQFHSNGISMFILAIIFYIACYHLLLYLKNKDISYYFYGMYALLLFAAYSLNVRNNFYYQLIAPFYEKIFLFRYLLVAAYAFFYFKFSFKLVEVEKYTPTLYKYTHILLYVFVGVVIISHTGIFLLNRLDLLEYSFMYIMAPLMTFIYALTIYMIIASKNILKEYLLFGSFLLVGGSLVSMFLYNFHFLNEYTCLAHPIVFSSMLAENMIFSLALGKKQHIVFRERLSYEQQLNEEKLSLLRSNLNPHFIFNVLNSIKSLIIDNKVKAALKSLGLFSKMMRKFLERTQEAEHSLSEELDILSIYIQAENIRYEEPINFEIQNSLEFDTKTILVPSLILQPFIENVVKHGFTFDRKNKKIQILISAKNESIHIVVKDNGKGLADHKFTFKSKKNGLGITKQRLEFFAKKVNLQSILTIKNRKHKSGVKVQLQMPLIFK